MAIGQKADQSLSDVRFGDIVRAYGPEASLGLFVEELTDAPDDPFVATPVAKVFLKQYLNALGDVPSFR